MLSTNTPNSVTIRLKHAHTHTRHMQSTIQCIWIGMWFMYMLDHYNQKLHEKYDYIQVFYTSTIYIYIYGYWGISVPLWNWFIYYVILIHRFNSPVPMHTCTRMNISFYTHTHTHTSNAFHLRIPCLSFIKLKQTWHCWNSREGPYFPYFPYQHIEESMEGSLFPLFPLCLGKISSQHAKASIEEIGALPCFLASAAPKRWEGPYFLYFPYQHIEESMEGSLFPLFPLCLGHISRDVGWTSLPSSTLSWAQLVLKEMESWLYALLPLNG